MNKGQEDNLNMFEATDGVLHDNNAVWSGNVKFSDAVTELDDNIDTIEELRTQQGEDTTGVTQDKQTRRQKLEDETFAVASIIVFYASTTNNRALLEKVNFTRTQLSRSRDNELPGMSGQVHEEAVNNAAALLPYGLTATMTAALDAALTDYVSYISKPREAIAETSAATEQLPAVFEATVKLLEERLDKGMELYRLSNPDFYTKYFNARGIVNSPTHTRALEVSFVTLDGSGNYIPCGHVVVNIDLDVKRRSSKKGNIRVQSLVEGTHHLSASLPGFDFVKMDFIVVSGETTKLRIVMKSSPPTP